MPQEQSEPGVQGRFGYVSAYNPQTHMARVKFPDKGDVVSGWLPVIVPNTKKNKDEYHLDIDEHVFCLMMGNGLEMGVVLGSIYDDTNRPPVGDRDIRVITFGDGTSVRVNRKDHVVEFSGTGKMTVRSEKGQSITLEENGNFSITGSGRITIDAKAQLVLRSPHIHTESNFKSEGSYG